MPDPDAGTSGLRPRLRVVLRVGTRGQPRRPRNPRGVPPLDQSQVARPHHRVVEFRPLDVRHWDLIVEAWADDDGQVLDDAWINEAVVDLGSQRGRYEYVTTIGFAA
ncbi:hypothetical protein [Streptomyces sp. NBC_01764]|uniref:hypothetical protein n=1 Tax=Streptomyces sp. NBC_01764 TaxID=2975935 RepID=UPI002B1CDB56|nr:hypothetical protein [Streptomyces sp. NBC_01764]